MSSQLPVSEGVFMPPLPTQAGSTLRTGLYMIIWILSSNFTILFNKWLIDTAGFGYPILLTSWHLAVAALVTQILARSTTLLDSRHALPTSRSFYFRTILPIGLFSTGSLVFSNMVYLYLSVSFIQMLKAASPVAVLFTSWVFGVAKPTVGNVVNILVIVAGVVLASTGEIKFSWIGTAFQLAGTMSEALRVILMQIMLSSEGLRMDALVGLYYYAPVCAAMNFLVALVVEVPHFAWDDIAKVGVPALILNAAVAFLINLVYMVLIARTSGLVTTLAGIVKNILLVAFSVVVFHTNVAMIQVVGYSISIMGLTYYSFGPEKLRVAGHAAVSWVASLVSLPSSKSGKYLPLRDWRTES